MSLGWRVPEQWLGSSISNLTLRLSARNLWTHTDYPGVDPEAVDSGSLDSILWRVEYYNLPPTRSFMFALQMGF